MNKVLAKITSARLEIQDRGILGFWIHVQYEEGLSQGIGGIALDTYDTVTKERVGTAYGCEVIRRLLLGLHVNDFSEMVDQVIWVHGEGTGLAFKPKGVSSLEVNDSKAEPIIFSEIFNQFKQEK
jgi:hypothetical protein